MLGRVLFALVCLIIATGLLLPIYPTEVATSGVADARDMLVAGTAASGCQGCRPATASGRGRAFCRQALPAPAHPAKACLHLTVYVIVRPLPVIGQPGDPQLLPPKLPTI